MLKSTVKKMISWSRRSLGAGVYLCQKTLKMKAGGVRILCYHKVGDQEPGYMNVLTLEFRRQMEFLKAEGYQTIGLADLMDTVAAPKSDGNGGRPEERTPSISIPDRAVIITFDDGFRNNFDQAFPILKKMGFKAVIFCTSAAVDNPKFSLESPNFNEREEFLTQSQIREMTDYGIEIGSHTRSHPRLPQLGNAQKRDEILGSKTDLEEKLSRKIQFFCYPYGEYDEETVKLVREAGYSAACSNIPGGNRIGDELNPYLLKRTEISGFDDLDEFEKKLHGAYDGLHAMLHWMRGRP